jgi:hypothetical protein
MFIVVVCFSFLFFFFFFFFFFLFFNLFLILGLFYIESNFYPSCITNSTFKNISDLSLFTDGGVLYLNSLSYMNFTVDRCIFVWCSAYCGGAIYLGGLSPWIVINRSRFENNIGIYGSDVYAWGSVCFSPNTITNTCTTNLRTSVFCFLTATTILETACYGNIVLFVILFIY